MSSSITSHLGQFQIPSLVFRLFWPKLFLQVTNNSWQTTPNQALPCGTGIVRQTRTAAYIKTVFCANIFEFIEVLATILVQYD